MKKWAYFKNNYIILCKILNHYLNKRTGIKLPKNPKGQEDFSVPAPWNRLYETGDAGWDFGKPAPPFRSLFTAQKGKRPKWLKPGRLINPGCGAGHDSFYFSKKGFDVLGVDFSKFAIKKASHYKSKGLKLDFLKANLLSLPHSLFGQFDFWLEHTCFCVIHPRIRPDYVKAIMDVLKPGGIVFGLFYRFDPPDKEGPPFRISESELKKLFSHNFSCLDWCTPKNSFPKRQNRERLIVFKKKTKSTPAEKTSRRS